ncbi:MAG: hypothetical protein ACRESX_06220 [Gammaproteobacteria bacterium]
MKHFATPDFWEAYAALPVHIQRLADSNYQLLKENPRHPSLHFKRIGRFWSVRVGLKFRALGVDAPDGVVWFWIGSHAKYDKLIVV